MPKVSICIPTYNQTQYLRKTLESILVQSYQDYEVIITDDTPSSLISDLIKEYDFKDKLRYYHNESPLGSPQNWNYCISKAKGEFIKILHHDDWFTYDDSLAGFVKILDDNPHIAFAFSSSSVLYENKLENRIHTISNERLIEMQTNPILLFLGNRIGSPSSTIFRREISASFDQKMIWLVDIDFYIASLIKNKEVGYIPRPLIATFAADDRISNSCINNKEVEILEYFYLYEKIRTRYSKYEAYEPTKCLIHLLSICDQYNVTKISHIRDCGYDGNLDLSVRIYLVIQNIFKKTRFSNIVKSLTLNILRWKKVNAHR